MFKKIGIILIIILYVIDIIDCFYWGILNSNFYQFICGGLFILLGFSIFTLYVANNVINELKEKENDFNQWKLL